MLKHKKLATQLILDNVNHGLIPPPSPNTKTWPIGNNRRSTWGVGISRGRTWGFLWIHQKRWDEKGSFIQHARNSVWIQVACPDFYSVSCILYIHVLHIWIRVEKHMQLPLYLNMMNEYSDFHRLTIWIYNLWLFHDYFVKSQQMYVHATTMYIYIYVYIQSHGSSWFHIFIFHTYIAISPDNSLVVWLGGK